MPNFNNSFQINLLNKKHVTRVCGVLCAHYNCTERPVVALVSGGDRGGVGGGAGDSGGFGDVLVFILFR